jgi:RimJ/RimL family protein N-acetyltransferase
VNCVISLKPMGLDDRDTYMEMFLSHNPQVQEVAEINYELLADIVWKEMTEKSSFLQYSIVDKGLDAIVGFINLQSADTSTPEIGIDIIDRFSKQGYAQTAITMLISEYAKTHDVEFFVWRVAADNAASVHIIKKLGGVYIGEEKAWSQSMIDSALKMHIVESINDVPIIQRYHLQTP